MRQCLFLNLLLTQTHTIHEGMVKFIFFVRRFFCLNFTFYSGLKKFSRPSRNNDSFQKDESSKTFGISYSAHRK